MKGQSIVEAVNPFAVTTGAFTLEAREISKLKQAKYQPESRMNARTLVGIRRM